MRTPDEDSWSRAFVIVLAFASMRGSSFALRTPSGLAAICLLAVVAACSTPRRSGNGGDDDDGTTDGGVTGDGNNGCADGTELVYVIDQLTNQLSQFDPSTKVFKDLGSLSCPTMPGATPFSMGRRTHSCSTTRAS